VSTNTDSEAGTARPVARDGVFATTHWSVVLAAGQADTTRAHDALAKLCSSYWYPLYAYVRRRGYSSHDAQDLTQAFFAQLLERQSLEKVDPALGRFRSFLLASMNHFLTNEWKKAGAKKRGGGLQNVSLDWAAAEKRYDLEPADPSSPDKAYEKQWAITLLDRALRALEEEYGRDHRAPLFAALKQTLVGSRESQPYDKLASEFGINEGAVKVAVHRLRKRYRELIRAEIADTVASAGEIDTEMRHLLAVLAGN